MTRRTARNVLLFGGGGLLLAGLVAVGALKQRADHDAMVRAYADALNGFRTQISPDYTGVIVAGVIAGLGAVMLIAALVTRAAQRAEPEPPAHP